MILLLQIKTADTAHTGIFASETGPFPNFWVGPGDEAKYSRYMQCLQSATERSTVMTVNEQHPHVMYVVLGSIMG